MFQVECERSLGVAPGARVDAGGAAADRAASIGADRQPNLHRPAAGKGDGHALVRDLDRGGIRPDTLEGGQRLRARLQGGDQMPVLDVPPERVQPDLRGIEANLRRAP